VSWVRGLRERLQEPMVKLQSLDKSVLDSTVGSNIQKQYDALMKNMQEYELAIVEDWCAQVRPANHSLDRPAAFCCLHINVHTGCCSSLLMC
jgi:hypothetical protein